MKLAQTLEEPPQLVELMTRKTLALFLDFDGTLVEIAPTPDSIRVQHGLGQSLERLAASLSGRLALVSGRSLADLENHLGPVSLARSGSHGLERIDALGEPVGARPEPMNRETRDALRDFVSQREGMIFEDKGHSAALHFRARQELRAEATAHAEQVASRAGMSVKHGSCVVEVLPRGARKSVAVRAFMERPPFRDSTPVFVGDDLTDEDGFHAAAEYGGFGILAGNRQETSARYGLANPAAVRDWLSL